MKHRKLRIAWSVVVVVLLVVFPTYFGVSYTRMTDSDYFYLPLWFVALPAALLASIAWLPNRFSLRTLLIATTLVAVVLGLFVWLAK